MPNDKNNRVIKKERFTAETVNTFPLDLNLMLGNKKSHKVVGSDENNFNNDREDMNGRISKTNK